MKSRRLVAPQQVTIIYIKNEGFIETPADFLRYDLVDGREFPVFGIEGREVAGLDCFWVLSPEVADEDIPKYQYEIVRMQAKALQLAHEIGYDMVSKVQDSELVQIAQENDEIRQRLIQKFGYDPRDTAWIEESLAEHDLERMWFQFSRETDLPYTVEWKEAVAEFNKRYPQPVTVDLAEKMSTRRTRFVLGSYAERMRPNPNKEDWVVAAKQYEETCRLRDERMDAWSRARNGKFPIAKAKQPVKFSPGPYFRVCIEKLPQLFTNPHCDELRAGIELEVVSYDPQLGNIRLDLPKGVRQLIRPDPPIRWRPTNVDYIVWVLPHEVQNNLEISENL